MTRPKTPNDQAALDAVRAHLRSLPVGARTDNRPRPPRDGEWAGLTAAERAARLRARYSFRHDRTGDDAA